MFLCLLWNLADSWHFFNLYAHGLRMPGEEIAFTAWPKIKSQSKIFRYGRSIFCLPHRPKISDFFDLCLHWVSVVRVYAHNWMQKTELHLVQIQDLRLRDFWYSLLQTVCRFWLRSIDLCPFIIGWNIFLSSILVLIQMPFMIYLCYILTAWKLQKYVVKTQVHTWWWKLLLQKKVSTNCEATLHWDLKTW